MTPHTPSPSRRRPAGAGLRRGVAAALLCTAVGLGACRDAAEGPADPAAPGVDAAPSLSDVAAAERVAAPGGRAAPALVRDPGEGFLTPEIVNSVALAGTPLRNVRISPDGARVTFLKGSEADPEQFDLYSFDPETGEESLLVASLDLLGEPEELSEEEKNRRERAREYGRGIIAYSWVDADTLLFPLGGDVYLYDLEEGAARQVTASDGYESDIKLSANKTHVAYVRDDELYVTELATGLERQVTRGATDTIRNAVASFVVQEELGRSTGYWISPDERRIAYTQIDESPIAVESRVDMGADGLTTIDQRYPFAGTDNARVRLGITAVGGGRTVWADLPGWNGGAEDDIYLTRVAWAPDGEALYAGILSRDNQTHTVYRVDARDGSAEVFYRETSPTWLNIRSNLRTTAEGFRMVSERDGMRRYYEITEEGARALTPEGLLVGSVLCEGAEGELYVSGWRDSPLENHIFAVTERAVEPEAGEGGEAASAPVATQLTSGEGRHYASFASDCSRYIGDFSSPDQPPRQAVYDAQGERLMWLNENALDAGHPYAPYLDAHITPEFGTLEAADGAELHYELYKPLDLRPGERRPAVTIVYGGPGVQRVHKGWERRELARVLAHHGFVVFQVDGRGSTNRGKAFEDHIHRNMAGVEVEDQIAGARWLASQPFINADRMGVYGWSYGGYMTLHMLAQTDLYAAGVSGAPVTDWSLYDTAYTERYLGDPRADNANHTEGAYGNASVMTHIEGLDEPVLVIHGMADDNVVFRHTVMLADAMVEAGKSNLSVMPYPGEKHGFRSQAARTHRDRQILEFFLDELGRSDEEG